MRSVTSSGLGAAAGGGTTRAPAAAPAAAAASPTCIHGGARAHGWLACMVCRAGGVAAASAAGVASSHPRIQLGQECRVVVILHHSLQHVCVACMCGFACALCCALCPAPVCVKQYRHFTGPSSCLTGSSMVKRSMQAAAQVRQPAALRWVGLCPGVRACMPPAWISSKNPLNSGSVLQPVPGWLGEWVSDFHPWAQHCRAGAPRDGTHSHTFRPSVAGLVHRASTW
jgi:hypothetical protein